MASGLDCLELRRLRYDLTFTYKLLSNKLYIDKDGNMIISSFPALIDIDVDSLFSFNSNFNRQGHVCKLYKTHCTKSIRQNFFACRIVNIWNSLPDSVCYSSQAAFSQSLKDTDLSAYSQCY